MLRPVLATVLLVAVAFSGCADSDTTAKGTSDESAVPDGEFHVPPIRVGDVYRYAFAFKGSNFEAGGITDVTIMHRGPIADGLGNMRDALHVVQASPDGSFAEQYWVDAATLTQFKIENRANYTEASHFPMDPLRSAPIPRKASYGNGTGTRERYHEDPVFEDYSFFGGFASDRVIPPVGETFSFPANFWKRDEPELLQAYSNLTGKVDKESVDETWGDLRHVGFEVEWKEGDSFETIEWDGSFSSLVPLTVECKRVIKLKFGSQTSEVTFNITLLAYQPGEGEEILRSRPPAMAQRRSAEFAPWQRAPADGASAKLMFPLSEALTALDKDPTAMQFFQGHPGAYLYVAHMDETDTCGFNSQPLPGCHWMEWEGRFVAPDDWQLDFLVEKFADPGGGAPAYVPAFSRDYPFDVLFSAGSVPEAPEPAVVAAKGSKDWGPRTDLSPDSLTIAGAIQAWKATAWANMTSLEPNVAVVYLEGESYAYYLSKEDWVFPSQNPELFFFYDDGPLVLERHTAEIQPDGNVLVSRNFWHQVTQR